MIHSNNPRSTTQMGWGLRHVFHNDDAGIPFYCSDELMTLYGEWNGKHIPVTMDSTANHQVKVAADGDALLGYTVMMENRVTEGIKLSTVQVHGATGILVKEGDTLKPGDNVVCAGGLEIRAVDPAVAAEVAKGHGRICTAILDGTDDAGNARKYADILFI